MDELEYAGQTSYAARPVGPHRGAELLCPDCGGLLALGWRPDREAVASMGTILVCAICKSVSATVGFDGPGSRPILGKPHSLPDRYDP
jgi:hypothetical protein